MSRLSRSELTQFLDSELERLQNAVETQEQLIKPVVFQVGDDADHALSEADRGKHRAVLEHLKQLLLQVQAARERLAMNKYGVCTDCERAIPAERLAALPYATLCVHCQSKREKSKMARVGLAVSASR